MAVRSAKKLITLTAAILAAFIIADVLSDAVVIFFHMGGPGGMIIGFVVYAVLFFAVLHLLEKYAHIEFFRFDGD